MTILGEGDYVEPFFQATLDVLADELMRNLAPLLAEDGVDINDVTDMEALNLALSMAVERRNMELFTPVSAAGISRSPF